MFPRDRVRQYADRGRMTVYEAADDVCVDEGAGVDEVCVDEVCVVR